MESSSSGRLTSATPASPFACPVPLPAAPLQQLKASLSRSLSPIPSLAPCASFSPSHQPHPAAAQLSTACASLLAASPYIQTALCMEGGRVLYQSPLSLSYYGHVEAGPHPCPAGSQQCLPDCCGAMCDACTPPLLRELFSVEGQALLREMLDAVVWSDGQGAEGSSSWGRVMRVPASCAAVAAATARPYGVATPAPLSPLAGAAERSASGVAPHDPFAASEQQRQLQADVVATAAAPATSGSSCSNSPSGARAEDSGVVAQGAGTGAAAASMSAARMKSMLELSLNSTQRTSSSIPPSSARTSRVSSGAAIPDLEALMASAPGFQQQPLPPRRNRLSVGGNTGTPSPTATASPTALTPGAVLRPRTASLDRDIADDGGAPDDSAGGGSGGGGSHAPDDPSRTSAPAARSTSMLLPATAWGQGSPPFSPTTARVPKGLRTSTGRARTAAAGSSGSSGVSSPCGGVAVGGSAFSPLRPEAERDAAAAAASPSHAEQREGGGDGSRRNAPSRLKLSEAAAPAQQQQQQQHESSCGSGAASPPTAAALRLVASPTGVASECSPRPPPAHSNQHEGPAGDGGDVDADGLEAGEGTSVQEMEAGNQAWDEEGVSWHEVVVTRATDDGGRELLLVYQNDVTLRMRMETAMAQLTEAQLNMLCQIFPRHVIEFMCTDMGGGSASGDALSPSLPRTVNHLARKHEEVTILFMDIVGFTSMSKQVAPETVMSSLNEIFTIFDSLSGAHQVQKVETAGDCYIVASGILSVDREGFSQVHESHDPQQSAARVFAFACDMLVASRQVKMPHDSSTLCVRIGIHTGSCVSGLVGSRLPKFGIFGDTMNTASRMESTCTPGRIQISSVTHALLMASSESAAAEWEATGGVEVKGKGVMDTYLWREEEAAACRASGASAAAAAQAALLGGGQQPVGVGAAAASVGSPSPSSPCEAAVSPWPAERDPQQQQQQAAEAAGASAATGAGGSSRLTQATWAVPLFTAISAMAPPGPGQAPPPRTASGGGSARSCSGREQALAPVASLGGRLGGDKAKQQGTAAAQQQLAGGSGGGSSGGGGVVSSPFMAIASAMSVLAKVNAITEAQGTGLVDAAGASAPASGLLLVEHPSAPMGHKSAPAGAPSLQRRSVAGPSPAPLQLAPAAGAAAAAAGPFRGISGQLMSMISMRARPGSAAAAAAAAAVGGSPTLASPSLRSRGGTGTVGGAQRASLLTTVSMHSSSMRVRSTQSRSMASQLFHTYSGGHAASGELEEPLAEGISATSGAGSSEGRVGLPSPPPPPPPP